MGKLNVNLETLVAGGLSVDALLAESIERVIWDKSFPGLGLRCRRGWQQRWIVQRRLDGRTVRHSGYARQRDGCSPVWLALLANGKPAPLVADKAKTDGMVVPTIAAFARTYQERKAVTWKPSGRRCTAVYLRVTLLPFFADMPLDRITWPVCVVW